MTFYATLRRNDGEDGAGNVAPYFAGFRSPALGSLAAMDSFEWNKIVGAVLGTAIFIFVVRLVAEAIYEPEKPAKPGYVVEGVAENPAGGARRAPVEEAMPDWGTVLATADVAAGKTISAKCEAVPRHSKRRPTRSARRCLAWWTVRAPSIAGFDYSSAMKAKGGTWTYDELFKFIEVAAAPIFPAPR